MDGGASSLLGKLVTPLRGLLALGGVVGGGESARIGHRGAPSPSKSVLLGFFPGAIEAPSKR